MLAYVTMHLLNHAVGLVSLEAMEDVLGNSNKIILDPGAAKSGAVPYLALPELRKPQGDTP